MKLKSVGIQLRAKIEELDKSDKTYEEKYQIMKMLFLNLISQMEGVASRFGI